MAIPSDDAPDGEPSARQERAAVPATELVALALQVERLPELRAPIVVCAFAGWNDAAQSATGAVRFLIERNSAPRFAGIDPEDFYVFTETRPTIRLVDGVQRQLIWPANDFHYLRIPRAQHDLVLLAGIEPQLNWRSFTATVLHLTRLVDASMLVSVGGLLADVPHSLPVKITGQMSHPDLLPNWPALPVRRSRYEGPTGIVGVLSDVCRRADLPLASLWVNVPHYINVSPNPKTMSALVHHMDLLFGLDLDLAELDRASDRFEEQVEEAVAQNPDIRQYVRRLEEAGDRGEDESEAAVLPSSDAIVAELEEFLRQRREDEDGDA